MKEDPLLDAMLARERELWTRGVKWIAGCDEAGRGPLAGPVVAAAVIFRPGTAIRGIRDSKCLSAGRREQLFECITREALAVSTGMVCEKEIDRINILKASQKAMILAIAGLAFPPELLLVDGFPLPDAPCPQEALVSGDRICYSIAAASIVAKVTRDRIMVAYDREFPLYGFAQNKGYPTHAHVQSVMKYGPCAIHRKSFAVRPWGSK